MKAAFTLLILLAGSKLCGQVFIEHNIPAVLATGAEREVDIIIHKPTAKAFSEYELSFSPGIAVSARNNAGGTFRGEDNKIRVMWSISPAGQIMLRLAFLPSTTGNYVLHQKYDYEQDGEKRTAYMEDLKVEVRAEPVGEAATPFARLNQVVPGSLPLSRIDSLEARMKDPAKAGIHVAQLRRDAREARKVGENELKEANLELKEAERALALAKKNTDEQVRAGLSQEAEERIRKAETNKQVALKILALAQSLEGNADEIERAGAARERGDSANGTAMAGSASRSAEEVAELRRLFNESSGKAGNSEPLPSKADTLYHIQVGAFGQNPGKAEFRKLGTVNVVNENGLYKVLIGGFATRDEAERKRQQLAGSGYDGFIVRYQGDRRVK